MVFRTELSLNKSYLSINYQHKILLIGSCFSDNIGLRLENVKIDAVKNPFGTVYNVASIHRLLDHSVYLKHVTKENLVDHQGVFAHPDFHSSFNHTDPDQVVININAAITATHYLLKSTNYTFVTLGTSWVYKTKSHGQIVANCHKLPQHFFEKELLSLPSTCEALQQIVKTLQAINVDNKVIFTISPVRHIKDGIVENQVSKAILIQAVFETVSQGQAHYFPSYELMMDDLRDYRFYKEDLIHPSDQALQYVWEKFVAYYFSDESIEIKSKIEKINAFLLHRPQLLDEQYKTHFQKVKQDLIDLNTKFGLQISFPQLQQ
jgi:GSCFA family